MTYGKKEEYDLIKEGDYECEIEKMEKTETKVSHRKKISVQFRVRGDVEENGEAKRRIIFDDIWSDKEKEGVYDGRKIARLLKTQTQLPDDFECNTIEDVIKTLSGSCMLLHIVIKHDDYRDEDVNAITAYKPSSKAPKSLDEPTSGNLPEIDDDDMPF